MPTAASRTCPRVSTRFSIRKGRSIRSSRSPRLALAVTSKSRPLLTHWRTRPRLEKAASSATVPPLPSQSTRSMPNIEAIWLLLLISSAAAGQTATPPNAGPYAGSEACGTCHEDISNAFAKSPHHLVDLDKKRGWQGRACEACHGPAQKHTESLSPDDIRNPGKLAAAAADQICLSCHLNQPTHIGRLQSSHAKDQVSCTACHKVHANGPSGIVARKASAINEQCRSCHLSAWAQFQKP